MVSSTAVTFLVQYDDPESPVDGYRKTRSFATEHSARDWIQETLYKIAPKATGVEIWKLTTERKKIF